MACSNSTTKRQSEIKSYLYDVTASISSMEEPFELISIKILFFDAEFKSQKKLRTILKFVMVNIWN